jgi:hypothetical protein
MLWVTTLLQRQVQGQGAAKFLSFTQNKRQT